MFFFSAFFFSIPNFLLFFLGTQIRMSIFEYVKDLKNKIPAEQNSEELLLQQAQTFSAVFEKTESATYEVNEVEEINTLANIFLSDGYTVTEGAASAIELAKPIMGKIKYMCFCFLFFFYHNLMFNI
jgi:hypothetical protein